MTSPGERTVYGVGPVRELVTRKPRSVLAVWVDPKRAEKSSGDPVAQIVMAACAAGINVEDRDRPTLDRTAGDDARHQGVVAWLGAFEYAQLENLITDG